MSKTVKIIFWVLVALILLPVVLITIALALGKVSNKVKTGLSTLASKIGLKKDDSSTTTPEPKPAVNSNMYIMLTDFTYYGTDAQKTIKTFKKDFIFQGYPYQADASFGIDKSLNLMTAAVMINVVMMADSSSGVPATACRLLTESELTEYNKTIQRTDI